MNEPSADKRTRKEDSGTGAGTDKGTAEKTEKEKAMKKEEVKRNAQAEAETAKQRLIDIEWELRDAGLIREANSLATIIEKLETWQNK